MGKTISILGAGLSGLSCAITLARNNQSCEVIEKQKSIGLFAEAEVRSLKNYSSSEDVIEKLKKIGLSPKNYCSVRKIKYYAPNGKSFSVFSRDPLFYNLIRGRRGDSLDNQYYDTAKSLGINFSLGADNVNKADVIASGSRKKDGIAYGMHLAGVRIDANYLIQDERYAPKGYVYILPYEDEATVIATSFDTEFDIKSSFEKLTRENKLVQDILSGAQKRYEIYGSGGFNLPGTACIDEALFVGESAGFVDASRGFGMYYAITSGFLAAKSIVDNTNYDKLWKKEFGKELFERFSRRQYINKLTNEDHNRMIEEIIKHYGTEIPVEVYQNRKKASVHKQLLLNLYAHYKLIGWRKSHPLN